VCRRQLGDRPHHGRRAAGIQPHLLCSRCRPQSSLESRSHEAAGSSTAIFGCENRFDTQPFEQIDVRQIGTLSGAVEKACLRSTRSKRLGQRDEGSEPDSTRHHPGLGRRTHRLERTSQWPEAAQATAGRCVEEQRRADADPLVEERNASGSPVGVSQNLENRERASQQRIDARARLDHHELTGLGQRGDVRGCKREHAVVT
jgi:hypothetical protein